MLHNKLKCWVRILLFTPLALFLTNPVNGCTIVCNDNVNLSIDASGQIEITPDMVHEGDILCPNPLFVSLTDESGLSIGNIIDCQHVGQTITAMLTDPASGNSCWGYITVEDKLSPEVSCTDVTINCTDNIAPSENGPVFYPQVSDNCSAINLEYTDDVAELDCSEGFSSQITRTWVAFDAMNNSASCIQHIAILQPTLSDVSPPEYVTDLACHADTSPEAILGPELFGMPLYQNIVCSFTATYQDSYLELCGETQKIIRSWYVFDMCLNTSEIFTQLIKTNDFEPPVVYCPDDITVSTDGDNCFASYTNNLNPEVFENCGDYTLSTSSQYGIGDGPFELPPGTHLFTFTVTDDCGNSESCNYNVTVEDNITPVVICDDDIIVAVGADGMAELCVESLDAGSYDNCAIDTMLIRRMDSCLPDSAGTSFSDCILLDCCDVGQEVMVILGVWDTVGNYNECMAGVFVQDKLDPIVICPPDLTLECDQYPIPDTVLTGEIIVIETAEEWPPQNPDGINGYAYDNCEIDTITVQINGTVNDCGEGTIIRVFTVYDTQGRSDVCTQRIRFEDTVPSVITFPPDVTIDCTEADDFSIMGEAAGEDNCSTFAIGYEDTDISLTDQPCVTKLLREWTVFDWCEDELFTDVQTVLIIDDEGPVFDTDINDITLNNICFGEFPPEELNGGVTDNCGDVVVELLEESVTPGNCPNNFTIHRIWKATDDCGQMTTTLQNIIVEDITPPTFIGVPQNTTISCEEAVPLADIVADDNCDNNLPVTETQSQTPGDCPDDYTITRVWTATDLCGNQATTSQEIVVEDNTPPTFTTFPNDLTFECSETIVFPNLPTADDNCDTDVSVTFEDEMQDATTCPQESFLLRTYTATDNCGNFTTQVLTITIIDTTAPILDMPPANTTIECDVLPPDPAVISASDNCDFSPEVLFSETTTPGNCPSNYTIIRTWTATDACGNTSAVTRNIIVEDTTAPIFNNVPANTSIECDETLPVGNPSATDNCDDTLPNITFTENTTPGVCIGNATIIRTWTVSDLCGNSASTQQQIDVFDTTPPQFSNIPVDASLNCEDSDDIPAPDISDNCDPNPALSHTDQLIDGDCLDNSSIIRTWMATDDCGNTSTVSATFTLLDLTAPEITGPANLTVECDDIPPVVPIDDITTSDNCASSISVVYDGEDTVPGACPQQYTLVRNWTATDFCGNSTTTSQMISVDDTTPPVLTLMPDALTVECDNIPAFTTPLVDDNCSTVQLDSFVNFQALSCNENYLITVNWIATDACGNSASTQQLITVEDTTPPEIEAIPDEVTIECDEMVGDPVITDNCDPDPMVVFDESITDGDCPNNYTIDRSWTATDNCGNVVTRTQRIIVQDTEPPVFEAIDDITADCANIPDPTAVSATDNCSDNVMITPSETIIPGICSGNYTLLRIWTATDECGNTASLQQQIDVSDTTAPQFSNVPVDATFDCEDIEEIPAPDLDDNCDPNPALSHTDQLIGGDCVDNSSIIRTWTATDDCGNTNTVSATFTLLDLSAPEITGPPNLSVECDNIPPVISIDDITTSDNCASAITVVFNGEDIISGTCPQQYTLVRLWTASDLCGNSATTSQLIAVDDTTPPVLTLMPDALTVECDNIPAFTTPLVEDNCGAVQLDSFVNFQALSCNENYLITINWVATDPCGNSASIQQLITVEDTTPPEIGAIPDEVTIECDEMVGDPVITDNCDPDPTVVFDESITDGNCPNNYTIDRSWTATDNCGNVVTKTQRITVQDTESPVFEALDDITADCANIPDPSAVNATDNCTDNVMITPSETIIPGICSGNYTILRTWTATDECGNTASLQQQIDVSDTTAPQLSNIPIDATLNCEDSDNIPTPDINDNCDPNPALSHTDQLTGGDCVDNSSIIRTWTATDDCGNTSTASAIFTILDLSAPEITVPPDFTVECDNIPPPPVPVVNDNCTDSITVVYSETNLLGICTDSYPVIRTWTATDECGNSSTISQVMSVEDTTPPVFNNIPQDETLPCSQSTELPSPDATDNCDPTPQVTLEEERIDGACDYEYTLIRTWTATDNCGNSATVSATYMFFDAEPPVLICPMDITTFSAGGDSTQCTRTVEINATVSDNCDPNPLVTTRIVNTDFAGTDFENMLDTTLSGGNNFFPFPQGTSFVTITAVDACGLMSTCNFTVFVNEPAGPSIFCQQTSCVELDPTTGIVVLKPDELIENGFIIDACVPIDTAIIVQPTYDCEDVFSQDTIIFLSISATDFWGNPSSCSVPIIVLDPSGFCGSPTISCDDILAVPEGETYIAGMIQTENAAYLENTMVYIEEDMEDMMMSNSNGAYGFTQLQIGNNYQVRPYKNDDTANGVTTFDMVLLLQHVLGINTLDSPYQLIAADINQSGTITTFDAVLLRKVILSIDEEFTQNTSWRFVEGSYTFSDPQNPFADNFPESFHVENIQDYLQSVNFTAVKIGDLNGSVQTGNFDNNTQNRLSEEFVLNINDTKAAAQEVITVSFHSEDFHTVSAMQFSLEFNSDVLEFQGIENSSNTDFPLQHADNFNVKNTDSGQLNFAWATATPVDFTPGKQLFQVQFLAKENLKAITHHFSINATPVSPVAYKDSGQEMLVALGATSRSFMEEQDFMLYQNQPNPFNQSTIIRFKLPEAGSAQLLLRNGNGTLIRQYNVNGTRGMNKIVVPAAVFPVPGIYYYQIVTEFGNRGRKMIFME